MNAHAATPDTAVARDEHYNFGYLDESTKRMLRRALLKAVAIPGYQVPFGSREMPLPYGWGTGGIQVTAAIIGRQDVLKVIDQGSDDTTNAINIRRFFGRVTGVQTTERTAEASIIQTRHRIPETPLRAGQTMVYQVPIPEPLRWLEPSETETRTMHALAEYGSMHVKLYEDIAHHGHIATTYDYPVIVNQRYMMRPSPIPKFDNPKLDRSPALMLFGAGREKRVYAVPPYTSSRASILSTIVHRREMVELLRAMRRHRQLSRRNHHRRCRHAHVRVLGHRILRRSPGRAGRQTRRRRLAMNATPLLSVRNLTHTWDGVHGCHDVDFDLYPGEVLCVVGESGSGKSTLLQALSMQVKAQRGSVSYDMRETGLTDLGGLSSARMRLLARTDWGFVRQHARDGLRMQVSAGANIAERLMAVGNRHYGDLREIAGAWLEKMEIDLARLDDVPSTFSGGMQQRLQIARNLVTHPRLVFMDEPTASLDVSVQARLLDLLRRLVTDLGLAAILVTHDLAVARLLAHRTLVMQGGRVVEQGLTDQILDDPQHPYTQLLVSSILQG